MFDIDYSDVKDIPYPDLLERIVSDLDGYISRAKDNELEQCISHIPDYDDGFADGMTFVRKLIIEVIDQLKTVESGKNVIFTYRGRSISLDKEKYKKTHLTTGYIDSCLCNSSDILEMTGEEIDYDEIAQRYSAEEIEEILDREMDEAIRLQDIDDNLDGEAFFRECVEFGEKLRRGEADVEDRPATETGKKLSILARALNHPEEGY